MDSDTRKRATAPVAIAITAAVGADFQTLTGIRRTQQYELINAGEVTSLLIGRRRHIVMDTYRAYVDRQLRAQAGKRRATPPAPKSRGRHTEIPSIGDAADHAVKRPVRQRGRSRPPGGRSRAAQ